MNSFCRTVTGMAGAQEHKCRFISSAASSVKANLLAAAFRDACELSFVLPCGPRGYPQLGSSFQMVIVLIVSAAPMVFPSSTRATPPPAVAPDFKKNCLLSTLSLSRFLFPSSPTSRIFRGNRRDGSICSP